MYHIVMSTDASTFKRTKIIATIGPASEEKLESLLASGVNGVRLNLSHNTHAWHAGIIKKSREAAQKLDRSVAVIADLQGPKIRLGTLNSKGVELSAGQKIVFCTQNKCTEGHLPIQYDFTHLVKKGDSIMLRDGTIETKVVSAANNEVIAEVLNSGKVSSNHGINLPDTVFDSKEIITKKDLDDLEFVYQNDVDYVALSFVQTANDIEHLRALIQKNKSQAKIIAKIETRSATKNLESIISATDAVMIARGDLAVETSNEDVPLIGREIIQLARSHKKPIIMATQMLESMISSPQPTRAEVNDIASAVSLGVSCVMLSGETAAGQYPLQTVQLMKRVILKTESYYTKNRLEIDFVSQGNNSPTGNIATTDAQTSVSMAAITLAEQVGAKLILAETLTGSTALSIASIRPPIPVIIASPNKKVCNQMAIVWGGKPYLVSKKQNVSAGIIKKLLVKKNLSSGDWVVQVFGTHSSVVGGTDTVRLLEV
jgi:pyruvate kinase